MFTSYDNLKRELVSSLDPAFYSELKTYVRWEALGPLVENENQFFYFSKHMVFLEAKKSPTQAVVLLKLFKAICEVRCVVPAKLDKTLGHMTAPTLTLSENTFSLGEDIFNGLPQQSKSAPVLANLSLDTVFFALLAYTLALVSRYRGPLFLAAPTLHVDYGILNIFDPKLFKDIASLKDIPLSWSRDLILEQSSPTSAHV